mgnify:CR=1 FL=1
MKRLVFTEPASPSRSASWRSITVAVLVPNLKGAEAAVEAGAHVSTMPFKILQMLFKHPLTDSGLKRFLDDWNKAGLSIFEGAQAR